MKKIIHLFLSGLILLLLSGCSTTPATVDQWEAKKDYKSMLSFLGEYSGGNSEKQALQARTMKYILNNKDESRGAVVEALSKDSGDTRSGACQVAYEWADPAFIDPLFVALKDSDATVRQPAGYAFKKQKEILDPAGKEAVALRLIGMMKDESEAVVLLACTSSLIELGVAASHEPLKSLRAEIYEKKTKKIKLLGTILNVNGIGYASMLRSKLDEAIKVTKPQP